MVLFHCFFSYLCGLCSCCKLSLNFLGSTYDEKTSLLVVKGPKLKFKARVNSPENCDSKKIKQICIAIHEMNGCSDVDANLEISGELTYLIEGVHEAQAWLMGLEDQKDPNHFLRFDFQMTFPDSLLMSKSSDRLSKGSRARLFNEVYETHAWACDGDSDSPKSGCASSSRAAGEAMGAVEEVVSVFKIKSILDLACGDSTWMRNVPLEDRGVKRYTGADISTRVIQANMNNPSIAIGNRNFIVLDAVEDLLPPHELIISRDMSIHLSPHDNVKFLQNVAATEGMRFFLSTTNVHESNQVFSDTDAHYLLRGPTINLLLPPVSMASLSY